MQIAVSDALDCQPASRSEVFLRFKAASKLTRSHYEGSNLFSKDDTRQGTANRKLQLVLKRFPGAQGLL